MTTAELQGKRVLITGAGRGIGRAVAEEFASAGASVVVASRTTSELDALVEAIQAKGGAAAAATCDVGDDASVAACVAMAEETFGGIDILVNSAGISPSAPLHHHTIELWNEVLNVNLTGAFRLTQAVLPGMQEGGWGRIIHLASIAGKTGMEYVSAYCASKHGLLGFIRAVSQEIARSGVTINAVCPGYVDTPMTERNVERIAERTGREASLVRGYMEELSPQKRLMECDEVAAMVLHLSTHAARGINGQGLNICGGSVMS
jgi:NAD(P)-dependent dehydrogenase (short-subunit alcohol dehydrogenase family)